jgi:hypothetical protein
MPCPSPSSVYYYRGYREALALGLPEDIASVQAAVTLSWSQGPIEGSINRLNMLKRQGLGRARLDYTIRSASGPQIRSGFARTRVIERVGDFERGVLD